MSQVQILKIMVIGNAAGGKTLLSKRLSEKLSLPLLHIDSIQFLPGMKIRPHHESIKYLRDFARQEKWVMDGFGPLDLIEERLLIADRILFIDLPVWRHLLWALKRQIQNIWRPRAELPEGCNELSIQQTTKLLRSIWITHKKMRPELLKIMNREHLKSKVIRIQNLNDWKRCYRDGI